MRFLAAEAEEARRLDANVARGDRYACEAVCISHVWHLRVLNLTPMDEIERRAYRERLKAELAAVEAGDFRYDPQPSTVGCGGLLGYVT